MQISQQGLENLKNYKYVSGGYSKLDNILNKIFWIPIVEYLPMWLAPNLITFAGFVCMNMTTAILLYQDYVYGDEPESGWALILNSLAIFIYQTLDAIDGKQARRTNSSSPLGQLFDHGCDAAITVFFIIGMSIAIGLDGQELFYSNLGVQLAIFGVNNIEYHTGVMHTQVSDFGVTEAHYFCIIVNLISAFLGKTFWRYKLFGLAVYRYLYYLVVPTNIILSIIIFTNLIRGSNQKVRIILEWISMLVFIAIQWLWTSFSIYEPLHNLVMLNFGFLLSLMLCKLIICSKSKDQYSCFHKDQIPFYIFTIMLWLLQVYDKTQYQEPVFWLSFITNLKINKADKEPPQYLLLLSQKQEYLMNCQSNNILIMNNLI